MFGYARLGQAFPMPPRLRRETLGQRWWMHHIMNTRGYLEATLAGQTERSLMALRHLWQAVLEWQHVTGSWAAGVLMAEHTALAKLLVDGFASGAGPGWTKTAIDALVKNVDSHSKLFPRAPEEFARLFGEHTLLAGTYITDLGEGRSEDFEATFAKALRNGRELARFTDTVFGQRAR